MGGNFKINIFIDIVIIYFCQVTLLMFGGGHASLSIIEIKKRKLKLAKLAFFILENFLQKQR